MTNEIFKKAQALFAKAKIEWEPPHAYIYKAARMAGKSAVIDGRLEDEHARDWLALHEEGEFGDAFDVEIDGDTGSETFRCEWTGLRVFEVMS